MKSLLVLVALAGIASAQPKISDLVVMTFAGVTPSMATEFEARSVAIRDAYQRSGAPYRFGYVPLFGRTFTYLSITPVTAITDWDNGPDLGRRMGEAAYQKWLPEYRKTITRTERKMARVIPDLTIQDVPMGSQPIMVLQLTRVEFSRRAEFEARIRTATIPALKKAGVKRYVVRRTIFGGPSNEYVSIRLHSDSAAAEKANQALASIPMPAGLILSNDRLVFRINPKTSFAQGVEIR